MQTNKQKAQMHGYDNTKKTKKHLYIHERTRKTQMCKYEHKNICTDTNCESICTDTNTHTRNKRMDTNAQQLAQIQTRKKKHNFTDTIKKIKEKKNVNPNTQEKDINARILT